MSTYVETTIRIHLQANDAAQETIDWAEIVAHLDADAPLMAPPRRSNPYRIGVAVAAAVITVLLFGVLPLLVRNPEIPPSDTVVTTAPVDPVLPSTRGVLGPGSWSVVATFPGEPLSPGQLAEMVSQVETWPGVLDVSGVQDQAAWRQFTGIVADCDEGAGFSPCGAGIVVLATTPWTGHTGERLETEYGMEAITAIEAERAFVEGYIAAALERTSPVVLEFDPSGRGVEQSLAGPVTEVDGDVCDRDTCVVVVKAEVDGHVVVAGLSDDLVIDVSGGGTGFSARDLMIDDFGRGGAIAQLSAYTDLDAAVGPRRLYVVAGLPLDAAVVTTELVDGTRVWQRPVGGMSLIVDKVASIPERFRDYYDQDGHDPDDSAELGLANPLFVLDRAGAEIMRIEDTGHGGSVVIDLRFDPDAVSKAIETPFPPTVGAGPVVIPGYGTLTWTESVGEVPPGFFQAVQPGPLKLGKAQVGDTILMFEDSPIDIGAQGDLLAKGVEGDNEYRLMASSDNDNWTHVATIQAGPILQIAAGDSFWVYGPMGYGGPNIERFRNSATIWISTDADEWVPVDISFSQWHSIVFVGADAIYIRGAGAGTDTNHYWIGTFER